MKNICFLKLIAAMLLWVTSLSLSAQESCDAGIQFNFCPTAQDMGSCTGSSCFNFQYELLFLPQSGGPSMIPFEFISVHAVAELIKPECGLSTIDVAATTACLVNNFGLTPGSDFEVSEDYLVLDLEESSGPYMLPLDGTPFAAIVIDAYPGEEIDLEFTSAFFQWDDGGEIVVCPSFPVQTCNANGGVTTYTMPDPSSATCASPPAGFQMALDAMNPQEVEVTIQAGASSLTIQEFDFVIDLVELSGTPIVEPNIIFDGFLGSDEVRVECSDQGDYVVYVHAESFMYDPGPITAPYPPPHLFSIDVGGPSLTSLAGEVSLEFREGRMERTAGECCEPFFSDGAKIIFDGDSPCMLAMDDFTFKVEEEPVSNGVCEVRLRASLDWQTMGFGTPLDFNEIRLRLGFDFSANADITIEDVIPDQSGCGLPCTFSCNNGSSVSNCVEIGNDYVDYCAIGSSSVPLCFDKGAGFTIVFKVIEGCIENVNFEEALIWVTSEAEACVPNVEVVEDDFPACPPQIFGTIQTNDPLVPTDPDSGPHGVDCTIYITSPTCPSVTVNQSCDVLAYSRCVCDPQADFTVTPFKDDDLLDGVTTFDIVLITKHILNVEYLDSPYKLFAADVNKSGSVTTFDLLEIRKAILFITLSFPNNTSWRFFDASIVPPSDNPFSGMPPEVINFNNGVGEANFVAVKVGDVNDSSKGGIGCPGFAPNDDNVEERNKQEAYYLGLPDISVKKGETFKVPFTALGSVKVSAFQAGLWFDTEMLDFVCAIPGKLEGYEIDMFNVAEADRGILRTLWYTAFEEERAKNGDVLFELELRAKQDIENIGKYFEVETGGMRNLAFEANGSAHSIALRTMNLPDIKYGTSTGLRVLTYPNPFSEKLTFEVESADGGVATLTMFDVSGRVVLQRELSLSEGWNSFETQAAENLPSGVLTYRLRTACGIISGKITKFD